jgi:20S proteasome subunit beta 2
MYLYSGYKEDLNEADAVKLVRDAIAAGVYNDLGSGSNVDVKIIRLNGEVEYHRNHEQGVQADALRANIKRPQHRIFPKGTTVVVSEVRTKTAGLPAQSASGGVGESKMDVE